MAKGSLKKKWFLTWGPPLVCWLSRLWLGTVRVEIEDLEIYLPVLEVNKGKRGEQFESGKLPLFI